MITSVCRSLGGQTCSEYLTPFNPRVRIQTQQEFEYRELHDEDPSFGDLAVASVEQTRSNGRFMAVSS